MFKRTTALFALLAYSLTGIAARPITVKLQNNIPKKLAPSLSPINAYYRVSLNRKVPKPGLKHLALTGGLFTGASQESSISGEPCGANVPICSKGSFGLVPGASCCLAIQLNPSAMSLGYHKLSPVVGTLPTPSTYNGHASAIKILVQSQQAAAIVGDYFREIRTATGQYKNLPNIPLGYYIGNRMASWSLSEPIPSNSSDKTYLNSVACGRTNQTCVAVGNYRSGSSYFSVSYSSLDGGRNWTPSLTNFPSQFLYGVACSKSGESCIAVGNTYNKNAPIFYMSTNHGQIWTPIGGTIDHSGGTDFNMESIACDAQVQRCTAVGYYKNSNQSVLYPLTYHTQNGGTTWTRSDPTPANASQNNFLNGISCDATGKRCIAVGDYQYFISIFNVQTLPLAYYTQNGGLSWTQSSPVLGAQAAKVQYLNGVSCSTNGLHCVAVGNLVDKFAPPNLARVPLSYYTNDGGHTWLASAAFPLPSQWSHTRRLNAVACDTQGQICNAVGFVGHHKKVPMMFLSLDGGKSWNLSTFQAHNPYGNFLNSVALS